MKCCHVCGESKSQSEFHRDKRNKDGLSGRCKVCAIAGARVWYAEHRERAADACKTWRASNPELVAAMRKRYKTKNRGKVNEYRRAHYAAHPEKYPKQDPAVSRGRWAKDPEGMRAWHKGWRDRNPDLVAGIRARRQKRLANCPVNDLTPRQWVEILALHDHRCYYCLRRFERLTLDHATPISRGGSHTASNVVPACARCNRWKHTRTASEFFALLAEQDAALCTADRRLTATRTPN